MLFFHEPDKCVLQLFSVILKEIWCDDLIIIISPEHCDGCQLGIWKLGPEGILVSPNHRRPKYSENTEIGNIRLCGMSFDRGRNFEDILWRCKVLTRGKKVERHPLGPHIFS